MTLDSSASIAAISYGLAAAAFAFLALTSRGRDGPPGVPGLAVPAAASFLWASILSLHALLRVGQEFAALAELGRNLVWVWFLWRNLRALRAKTEATDTLAFLGHGLGGLAIVAVAVGAPAVQVQPQLLEAWVLRVQLSLDTVAIPKAQVVLSLV